jgi:hypothetical protein
MYIGLFTIAVVCRQTACSVMDLPRRHWAIKPFQDCQGIPDTHSTQLAPKVPERRSLL